MSKKRNIDCLYKVLGLYEDAKANRINFDSYSKYVYRLYVKYLGLDKEEISSMLMGIYNLGDKIDHDSLRGIVFSLIEMEEKDGA